MRRNNWKLRFSINGNLKFNERLQRKDAGTILVRGPTELSCDMQERFD